MQNLKLFLVLILVILFFGIMFYYLKGQNPPSPLYKREVSAKSASDTKELFKPDNGNIYLIGTFKVSYITDGDTIHVVDNSGKEDKVRFLVVNTPEIHKDTPRNICLGKISAEFTKQNLLGKDVELYGDTTQPKRDKYNRLLAYVHVASSTDFFNDELMITGMAKVYKASPPGTYYQKYLDFQNTAQKNNLGMWNPQTCN